MKKNKQNKQTNKTKQKKHTKTMKLPKYNNFDRRLLDQKKKEKGGSKEKARI